MDYSQYEEPDSPAHGGELVVARHFLPATLHVLPQESRPIFPGQALPMIVGTDWAPTIKAALEAENPLIGIVLLRRNPGDPLSPGDFYTMGTACRIHRVQQVSDQLQVLIEGIQRFRIVRWISSAPPLLVRPEVVPDERYAHMGEVKAYAVAIINTVKELLPLNPLYAEEFRAVVDHFNPNEPSQLADFAAALTTATREELQEVLETTRIKPRLEKVLTLVHKELEVARSQAHIREQVEREIQGRQREMILREQLKAIQKELGISKDDRTAELEEFRARLTALSPPEQVQKRIDDEMKKLGILETGSPEYAVTRNYLDALTSIPWGVFSQDALDIERARKVLDKGHDALEDVKERIIEFLGVGIRRGEVAGSIILFVGPPGVGKTSLGRSIADALERKFFRFSLGGMRDEAEIKGHRRTYIGAMAGKLAQALTEAGTSNPVIMLDEIDKIGASFRGDPASALLEVLDPEQNAQFLDHYLDVRLDLSRVLFICTANQLDTIPSPLLDRMEVIRLSGYLTSEKIAIAERHLLPRQLRRAGLKKKELKLDRRALRKIIDGYAREAGVRRLEKRLGAIARKVVIRLLGGEKPPLRITVDDVEPLLGRPDYQPEERITGVGVVTGLAWTPLGGVTLAVEATRSHGYGRGLKLTGQLGDVMRESAEIAYSFVVDRAADYGFPADYFKDAFVHLHVPAGATPKDGPSAGITIATALVSLARGRKLRAKLAMTGELTLTGHVLPVGGIREKVIAARRTGIRRVLLPKANEADYQALPGHIVKGLHADFVAHYDEVHALLWG